MSLPETNGDRWNYGASTIDLDSDGKVIGWSNIDNIEDAFFQALKKYTA